MSKIAFFDFDGTITTSDTLLEIVKFEKGKANWLAGMLLLSPWLVALKLKLVNNYISKEKYLTHFFGGMPIAAFTAVCEKFTKQKLPSLIRPGALAAIQEHQQNGTPVVVVSASPENWLRTWCNANGIECIGTRLEILNGNITGRISGKNCYGAEKVNRIKERYNLDEYSEIYCYGDSSGDKELLSIATKPFYKPFRS